MHNEPGSFARRIATTCLRDIDAIAWRYVREVRELSGYLDSVIDDDELFRAAKASLEMLFGLIAGADLDAQLTAHSDALGRRRARQGIPLDSLLRAVRMDFRFLWNAMRTYVDEAEMPAFSDEVVTIWDAVEVHTISVHAGYMAELADMDRELELARAFLLRRLLEETAHDPRLYAQAAETLDLDPDGEFLVAVGSSQYAGEFRAAIRSAFPTATIDRLGGVEFTIIEASSLGEEMAAALRATPTGLSPIAAGVEELGAMWRAARELAALVQRPDEAATLDRHWDRLAADRLDRVIRAYARQALAPLATVPDRERALQIEAVQQYLESGSITRTSEALYCHRNTILNRLNRFSEATGLDPTVPYDAGTIRLVLAVSDGSVASGSAG
ncbi:helix-turn-helix domain-containing protein [Agromyces neolithicus]|uniref:PucR family transcriptional regulator n=1 Tax=Agromyces neolithicus TaxID=269420 RepID=A0ABN2LQJ4_9MICO